MTDREIVTRFARDFAEHLAFGSVMPAPATSAQVDANREASALDLCEHEELVELGPERGDAMSDHTLCDVQCCGCAGYFVATFWRIDRETELRPMHELERAQYVAVTTESYGGRAA